MGAAAISVIFADRLAVRFASLSEGVVRGAPALRFNLERLSGALRDLGALHPDADAMQALTRRMQEEASVLAFGDCYLIMAVCFILALLPVYFFRRTALSDGAGEGQ